MARDPDTSMPSVAESDDIGAATLAATDNTHLASANETELGAVELESHPDSLDEAVLEWLETIGTDRRRRRSDGHLSRLERRFSRLDNEEAVSRQRANSAPELGQIRDEDGLATTPRTPAVNEARSFASTEVSDITDATLDSSRKSNRSLVEEPFYRDNLADNGIYMQHPSEGTSEEVSDLMDAMRGDRDSPGPSVDEVKNDRELQGLVLGAEKFEVANYFERHILPPFGTTPQIRRSGRQPMAKHALPPLRFPHRRISNPVPDLLYGYDMHEAFPEKRHRTQLISLGKKIMATEMCGSLIYPFLAIEFEGDDGNIWAATNRCLGSGTACVHLAERLYDHLEQSGSSSESVQPVDTAAFSIVMNGRHARLHVSWYREFGDYMTTSIAGFTLQRPEHYIEFRKYVRNILDWGNGKRLGEIQTCLDTLLLEEDRKKASAAAKSRQAPFDEPDISCKRYKANGTSSPQSPLPSLKGDTSHAEAVEGGS